MKLPSVLYADGIKKGQQVKFGGLNHNLGADDGELWDMRNLTSDYFPLRPPGRSGGFTGRWRAPAASTAGRNCAGWTGPAFITTGNERAP